MPASARSRPRWRSSASSRFSSSVPRGSPQLSSTFVASMRHGKLRASRRGATARGWPPHRRSLRPALRWNCGATAPTSSRRSPAVRRCCQGSSSLLRRCRRPSLAADERGVATVVAALMVAMIFTVTIGGALIGGAVVARHRAQSAADLAALAAARRVPAGSAIACAEARAVAGAMGAQLRACHIDELDVVVAVAVPVGGRIGAEARAAARAGPAT